MERLVNMCNCGRMLLEFELRDASAHDHTQTKLQIQDYKFTGNNSIFVEW